MRLRKDADAGAGEISSSDKFLRNKDDISLK
jgi:hypothetical protein